MSDQYQAQRPRPRLRATTVITVRGNGRVYTMAGHFPNVTTCMLGDDTGTPVARFYLCGK
jgi:hypothetical protein